MAGRTRLSLSPTSPMIIWLREFAARTSNGTYEHIARSITAALVVRGKDVTSANILEFLLGDYAIAMLEDYTSQMLFKRQLPPLLPYEFKEFLFTRWFRGHFDVDNEVAFTNCVPRWVESGKWQLMTLPRFVALQNCTRGFAQIGRTGCDEQEQWMEQGSLLKHMNDIEVAIFQRSVETLINYRNGCIVVDDELVASRATDVEQKVVSNRKRGKEGPVVGSRGNSTPSLKQLRSHLYRKGSIRQFVFDTSYESLRLIATQKTIIRPPFFPPANTQRSLGETFFLQQYTSYCRKNSWPIKRNARERFVEDPFLHKLRLRSFVGFEHKAEPIRDVISGVTPGPDGRIRRKCVLCFVSGNKVPRESRNSEWKCCHAVWHERQNLKAEITRQGKRLLENRERIDNDARKRRQHAVNAYNKRRSPTKDGPQSQLDQEMEPTNQSQLRVNTIRDENEERSVQANVTK
ncbi:hypothetical protein IV203_009579 [Nitzschia inconspicua]|uniref:Uncharacterized protein n=1 Tax=Nitzschia inconspicua TaxID=303405 RepID=A0A9K3PMA1_9STRA|nr:hypothetical protein IV203_009579 [Nitzschia inconspicua]